MDFLVVLHPLVFEEHGAIPEAAGGELASDEHASYDSLCLAEEIVSSVLSNDIKYFDILVQLTEEVLNILLAVAIRTLHCFGGLEKYIVGEVEVAYFFSIGALLCTVT